MEQAAQTLSRKRLSDQLYLLLKEQITRGDLTPGQRLVEAEIARQFELSHAPVREAFRRLAHDGLVLQLPRRGTFVAAISEDEARRTYALRATLEEFAAREFCRHASDDKFNTLTEIVDQMESAARDDDLHRVIDLDISFHQTVWEATDHPLLPRIWPMVEASLRAFTTVSNRIFFQDLVEVAATHRPLLESLESRDDHEAGRRFHAHVIEVWRRAGKEPLPSDFMTSGEDES